MKIQEFNSILKQIAEIDRSIECQFIYHSTIEKNGRKFDMYRGTYKGLPIWKRCTTFEARYAFYIDSLFWFDSIKTMFKLCYS